MTIRSDTGWRRSSGIDEFTVLRWGIAILAVLIVHAAAVWLVIGRQSVFTGPSAPTPAVQIDLPPVTPKQAAPSPPEPTADTPAKSLEDDKVEPDGPAKEKPLDQAESDPKQPSTTAPQSKESVIKVPEAPRLDWVKDALALPSQSSVQAKAASSGSPAAWQRALAAHINRFQRYPGRVVTGSTIVVFTINRAGRVLSVSINASSGDPALDRDAVANVYRASPVPAPPEGFGADIISIVQSIQFRR